MAAADFSCFGTEPFWNLSIKGDVTAYQTYMTDESATVEPVLSRVNAVGVGEDYAILIKTANTSAAILTDASCTDGMSDNTYSKAILFSVGKTVLYGCCNEVK